MCLLLRRQRTDIVRRTKAKLKQGRTLTDFVVTAAHEAARQALMEAEIVRLSLADQERLAKALAKPPAPKPALRRAFSPNPAPLLRR